MEKLSYKIKTFIKTLIFFLLALAILPVFILSYICVQIFNIIILKLLSLKNPQYVFSKTKKIRTITETTRSPGIINFLLKVDGICDFNNIRDHYYTHVIEKRNKSGEIHFPLLRRKLISHWGYYAWIKDDNDFKAERHIILCPNLYRGRPLTEFNIQNYLSEVTAKHFPLDMPPWQVLVIPVSPSISFGVDKQSTSQDKALQNADFYYIFIRVHHILIAEEKNLHPNDILLIKPASKTVEIFEPNTQIASNLSGILKKPKHIPNLLTHISMTASNKWNEFIYRYDPLESPDVDKKQSIICLSNLLSAVFITIFTVFSDFIRDYRKTKNYPFYKLKFLINLFKRESQKRNLGQRAFIESICYSLNPKNVIRFCATLFWRMAITLLFLLPYYTCKEFMAAKDFLISGRTKHMATIVYVLSVYIPLIYLAIQELLNIIYEIVRTPRFIYEELFEKRTIESNILQLKSYRGRSVISISKSVDMEELRERLNLDPLIESEYLYSCIAGALANFFRTYEEHKVPAIVNVTSRLFEKGYFLSKSHTYDHISGVVFYQLPLDIPGLQQIRSIREITERIRNKQIGIYLASLGQTKLDLLTNMLPEVVLKLVINYLVGHFPITISEIHGDFKNTQTVWGQSIRDVISFGPQQSKTCLSINIHIAPRECRLAVMADSELSPNHCEITDAWTFYMENSIV